MQARTNFFGDRLHPTAQYQSEQWYWPTDEEFALIENIVQSGEYFLRYIERYGEVNAKLLLEHLFRQGGKQYLWLAKNLSTPGEENPLTEADILASLDQFDRTVVEPWLAKHGRQVPSITP